jgi:ubiquinone/menaquinone biosynthesis C-methylase UbiE
MEDSQSNQIEWWNNIARKLNGYQGNYQVSYEGLTGESEFKQIVLEKVRKFPNVLDIGCVDGAFAKEIAPYASKVTAVDLSPVMIAAAKNSYQEDHVEFIVANAKELPFQDHTFDLILSRRGPVSEPEFMEEAIRVTKSGGQILEITIGNKDAYEFKEIFHRGQGYERINLSRSSEIKERIESNPDLKLREVYEYYSYAYYPTIEDVILLLSSTPIVDDFEITQDFTFINAILEKLGTAKGIRRTYHRLIWIAEKI